MKEGGFWPGEDESPFAKPFKEAGKAVLPSVVVIDGLEILHARIERHMPGGGIDYDGAVRRAVAAGDVDLSAVERRYGPNAWAEADFVVLPMPEGSDPKRAFRMEGKKLLPPSTR